MTEFTATILARIAAGLLPVVLAVPLLTPCAAGAQTVAGADVKPEARALPQQQAKPELRSVRFAADEATGGATLVAIVTLTGRAPKGGAVVHLSCSASAFAPVPEQVTVPAGRTSAPLLIHTHAPQAATQITLTATLGASKTATLTLRPTTIAEVTLTPGTLAGGDNAIGLLHLETPAAQDLEIALTCATPGITLQPARLTLKKGETRAQFDLLTRPVKRKTVVTVTASANGTTATATCTLTP